MDILIKNGHLLDKAMSEHILLYVKNILSEAIEFHQKKHIFVRKNGLIIACIEIEPIQNGFSIEAKSAS